MAPESRSSSSEMMKLGSKARAWVSGRRADSDNKRAEKVFFILETSIAKMGEKSNGLYRGQKMPGC